MKTKKEIILNQGRFGHLALYSQEENSIYIFAGQQQVQGGRTVSVRDL